MPSTRITFQNDRFGVITGAITFFIAGACLGLCLDNNNATLYVVAKKMTCGGCIGGLFGGIIGFFLSRTARIVSYMLYKRPIPLRMILLGQILGSVEGLCIGALHGNMLDLESGTIIGWLFGTFIGAISWLIRIRIKGMMVALQLQLLIHVLFSSLIANFAHYINQFPFIHLLNGLLVVCFTSGFIRMRKTVPRENEI